MEMDINRALKIVSTVALGQFSGMSVYAALAVQPSIIENEDTAAACQLMRSVLNRSGIMPLSVLVGSLTSIVAFIRTRETYLLVSGAMNLALLPYTAILVSPINSQFRDKKSNFNENESKWKGLLHTWLTLHVPRAMIGFTCFSVGVYKLACEK